MAGEKDGQWLAGWDTPRRRWRTHIPACRPVGIAAAWLTSIVALLILLLFLSLVSLPEISRDLLVWRFGYSHGERSNGELNGELRLIPDPPLELEPPRHSPGLQPPPVLDPPVFPELTPDAEPDRAPEIGPYFPPGHLAIIGPHEDVFPRYDMPPHFRADGRAYGRSKVVDSAIRNALAWLVKQQADDGSWSLSGPFDAGIQPNERAAATAMAMLALQGSGHTHKHGKYKERLVKAKDWLVSRQQADGSWRTDSGHHRMYVQGLATRALCDLYAMTMDPSLKAPAENAVKYCVKTQSRLGGWRYNPAGQDSDVSVTGWLTMALHTARMVKLKVPESTFSGINKLLDNTTTDGGGRYGYLPGTDQATPAMTAAGLMCRQQLGWRKDDKRLAGGIEYLLSPENLPRSDRWDDLTGSGRDAYYWYYATQAIHLYGGASQEKWDGVLMPILVKAQVNSGREQGSWEPEGDKWGQFGGRLYVTCLSCLILETP
jgi:hypothetical protein